MGEVVRRLPVVECLVAVLNRGEPGGNEAGGEEPVEGGNGRDAIGAGDSVLGHDG